MTFSGGLIDMFLFGILQGNAKTSWVWIVVVGAAYFVVYYLHVNSKGSVIPVSIEVRAADNKRPATASFFSGFATLYMARGR